MDRFVPPLRWLRLPESVQQFSGSLERQTDLAVEARELRGAARRPPTVFRLPLVLGVLVETVSGEVDHSVFWKRAADRASTLELSIVRIGYLKRTEIERTKCKSFSCVSGGLRLLEALQRPRVAGRGVSAAGARHALHTRRVLRVGLTRLAPRPAREKAAQGFLGVSQSRRPRARGGRRVPRAPRRGRLPQDAPRRPRHARGPAPRQHALLARTTNARRGKTRHARRRGHGGLLLYNPLDGPPRVLLSEVSPSKSHSSKVSPSLT